MPNPPTAVPLSRREWLRTVGTALTGLMLAARLPGALALAGAGGNPSPAAPTPAPSLCRPEREYVLAFEAYPSG